MDILSTFCGVFTVQYVKLVLRITFIRYEHYTGEVEDIIRGRLGMFSCGLMTPCYEVVGFVFFCGRTVEFCYI